MRFSVFSLAALAFNGVAQAVVHKFSHGIAIDTDFAVNAAKGSNIKTGVFQQTLNHSDPNSPTFSQTFYYDTKWWKGPGSPVIMFAPQEANASLYAGLITEVSIVGTLAKQLGAATILMEHRYWGTSSPFPVLSTENMQHLTLENSIADCNNFARNVKLPFAPSGGNNAQDVPWVLVGGSYSGALTAWIEAKAPGTFWAYLASSAVVQVISNFWQYFAPVQAGMPQNCSKDVSLVIDHMDNVLQHGTAQQIHQLKAQFGLETVEHDADFMEVLANGPYLWQATDFAQNAGFFEWCDYVENSVNKTSGLPGAQGVGLQKALSGYAEWVRTVLLPNYCYDTYGYAEFNGVNNTACFDSYNPQNPIFTDTSLSNTADRQWIFYLCNQPFGYWQDGAPQDTPTIVSRLVTAQYQYRQCALYFPPGPQGQTYGIAEGRTEAETNAYTGGWNIDNTTRLIYTNGQYDPWRDTTVSSTFRPGGPLASTSQVPVNIVPGGRHCSDLITVNGKVNAGCLAVQNSEISQLEQWVAQWPKKYQS